MFERREPVAAGGEMSWFSKPKKPEKPEKSAGTAPQPNPEEQLAVLLRDYEKHFYEKTKGAGASEAEEAQRIVAAARKFVSESRLGYALARPLLSHVKHWPARSKREDFAAKYANGPFQYLDGSSSGIKPQIVMVSFSYNANAYTLRFVDKGMPHWGNDMNAYGKVELIKDETTVLGLDIKEDLSKGDATHWAMSGVFAFAPGDWMKELIEMGAYIDGLRDRRFNDLMANDMIARAKRIKLPD